MGDEGKGTGGGSGGEGGGGVGGGGAGGGSGSVHSAAPCSKGCREPLQEWKMCEGESARREPCFGTAGVPCRRVHPDSSSEEPAASDVNAFCACPRQQGTHSKSPVATSAYSCRPPGLNTDWPVTATVAAPAGHTGSATCSTLFSLRRGVDNVG
jgi:hypothetical protein